MIPALRGHRARERAQRRVVWSAHVGKARAESVVVRPHQRAVAEQVDVIGDQHQVAGAPVVPHSAARVAHDERAGAKLVQHAHWKCHLLKRIPFIAVEAPLHRRHSLAAECAEQQASGVRDSTVESRERGDVRVLD